MKEIQKQIIDLLCELHGAGIIELKGFGFDMYAKLKVIKTGIEWIESIDEKLLNNLIELKTDLS